MTTINDLCVANSFSGDDKVPMWSNANGVTRALPLSVLTAGFLTQDSINALAASATVETFASGSGFTPGTTTSITLANQYLSKNNIEVFFDASFQGPDQFTLVGNTLAFISPIPVGVQSVYVRGGATRVTGAPSDGTVNDAKVASGSKLWNRIAETVSVYDYASPPITGFPMIISPTQDDTAAVEAAFNLALQTGRPVNLPFDRDVYITRPIDLKPRSAPSSYTGQVGIHTARANAILLRGQGGRAIKAAPNFVGSYMMQLIYDSSNGWIAPMWSGFEDFIFDGSGIVDTALISNYCMNVQIRRIRATGVNTAFKWIGYGVAQIDRCEAFAQVCVDFSQGGGDSVISNCDFYPMSRGVIVGPSGGDFMLRDTVFTRQDADFPGGSTPIAVASTITTDEIRDIRVMNCEFSGMQYGVSLAGSGGFSVKRVVISGCHTTPSAGGALWTGSLALLQNVQEGDISGNFAGFPSTITTNGTPIAGVGLTGCKNIGIRGNQFSYLTASAVVATNCTGLNINDNRLNNVAMVDGTGTAIYLQNVTTSTVSLNTAQKTEATAGGTFITELGTSTANRGVGNNPSGFATFATLAGGSTSTYS
jgi:hypothetical protein